MPRPRSTDTAEFKLRAVMAVTEQKSSVAEVARRLDIGENSLREWRKAFLAKGGDAFPGHGHPTPAKGELRRLRAENARLRAERDLFEKGRRGLRQPAELSTGSSPTEPTGSRSPGCARRWRCRPAGTTPGPPGPTAPRGDGGGSWPGRSRRFTPMGGTGTGARGRTRS